MKPIIRVEGLSKQYRIGTKQASYATLRESLTDVVSAPFRRLRNARHRPPITDHPDTIWALKDVSFEVQPGEVVGIIGRNGAGKSTLLKILSRITEPTEGRIDLYGRVGSLLEVGTGFHAELTGRENIYLNGAILGMKNIEIARHFDEIVAFAEIEKFLDTPVKHYSSGMYMRLAFAVAAHLEPEVLIIDEVLAVGDSGFQNKCVERMQTLAKNGCSLLFVSHNMSAVQSMCSKVMLLKTGIIEKIGNSVDIVREYYRSITLTKANCLAQVISAPDLKIKRVYLSVDGKTPCNEFQMGDSLRVCLEYEALRKILQPQFSIGITEGGWKPLALASMLIDGRAPKSIYGRGCLTCNFNDLSLMPKTFQIWGSVRQEGGYGDIIDWQQLAEFLVTNVDSRVNISPNASLYHLQDDAPIYLSYDWVFEDDGQANRRDDDNYYNHGLNYAGSHN